MSGVTVRKASPADAAGVNAVYNPFIRESVATFETAEHTEAKRRSWLEDRAADARYPVFVAEAGDGNICGFANAAPFDERAAYATSVKVSVFVDPVHAGRGAGKALYRALFAALPDEIHRAYALIVTPNPASVALHEAFGFTHVSTLTEVGRKYGRYCDVMWFEKRMG